MFLREFLLVFFAVEGKKRSFSLGTEYDDSGASMIASQMIASESRGGSLAGEVAGYEART